MNNTEISVRKDADMRVKVPVYSYERGLLMNMSKREKMICDEFVRTRSYKSAGEVVGVSERAARHYLKREHVARMVGERLVEGAKAEGWTRERWMAMMSDHLRGDKRLKEGDLYAMKLMATALQIGESQVFNMFNAVQFTQSNGNV